MSRPRLENERLRDKAMYERYTVLCKKVDGVQRLSHEYVMQQLKKEFFIEPSTIMFRIKRYARELAAAPLQSSIEFPSNNT